MPVVRFLKYGRRTECSAKRTALVLVLLFRATTDQNLCCSRGCTFHLLPVHFQYGTVADPGSQTTAGIVTPINSPVQALHCDSALGSALLPLLDKYSGTYRTEYVFALQRTGKITGGLNVIDFACAVLSALKVEGKATHGEI